MRCSVSCCHDRSLHAPRATGPAPRPPVRHGDRERLRGPRPGRPPLPPEPPRAAAGPKNPPPGDRGRRPHAAPGAAGQQLASRRCPHSFAADELDVVEPEDPTSEHALPLLLWLLLLLLLLPELLLVLASDSEPPSSDAAPASTAGADWAAMRANLMSCSTSGSGFVAGPSAMTSRSTKSASGVSARLGWNPM